jgi:hypothetical protein
MRVWPGRQPRLLRAPRHPALWRAERAAAGRGECYGRTLLCSCDWDVPVKRLCLSRQSQEGNGRNIYMLPVRRRAHPRAARSHLRQTRIHSRDLAHRKGSQAAATTGRALRRQVPDPGSVQLGAEGSHLQRCRGDTGGLRRTAYGARGWCRCGGRGAPYDQQQRGLWWRRRRRRRSQVRRAG